VPRVLRGEALAEEDVPQVAAAGRTLDLDPLTVRVRKPLHRAGDLLVEARPATARVELGVRDIERCVTAAAHVRALLEEVVVLTAERGLRALVNDDPRFCWRERIHALSCRPRFSAAAKLL
jgi:hypothetical protein